MEERKLTNAEMIKALRWCGSDDERHEMCVDESYSCPMWNEDRMTDYCKADLMLAAADALEAAEKRIATYQSDVADLEQREKELNDVLNERARLITELNTKCADLQSQINSMESEIEELLPKEAHWVAVHNGMGVCSNCNRQDRIDNLATHCRYCGSRIKYSCKDLFDEASNLPVDYNLCANIYCANDKNHSENPNS